MLHSRSPDAQQICSTADIVVAAVGKPEVVKGDWVKEGAAVIDVGTNAVDVRILLLPYPLSSSCFLAHFWARQIACLLVQLVLSTTAICFFVSFPKC